MRTTRHFDVLRGVAGAVEGRQFTVATLRELLPDAPSGLRDDAELVVSELLTNSLHAGAARVRLEIAIEAGGRPTAVTVRVTDDAPGEPRLGHPGAWATGGRGLAIVEALATRWGVRRAGRGKQVWARLEPAGARPRVSVLV